LKNDDNEEDDGKEEEESKIITILLFVSCSRNFSFFKPSASNCWSFLIV
jgi:hypothetical protein